jgi:hypothetical protein
MRNKYNATRSTSNIENQADARAGVGQSSPASNRRMEEPTAFGDRLREPLGKEARPEIRFDVVRKIAEETHAAVDPGAIDGATMAPSPKTPPPKPGPAPVQELLLPVKTVERRTLRGTKAIAAHYYGSEKKWRTINRLCAEGAFPYWKDGAIICSDTQLLGLWKFVRQMYGMLRLTFTREDSLVCMPVFAYAMQHPDPDLKEEPDAELRLIAKYGRGCGTSSRHFVRVW